MPLRRQVQKEPWRVLGNNCRWGDKTLKTSLADPIANKRAEDKRQDHRHDPIVVLLTLDGMNSLDEVLLDFLSPVGRVTRKLGFRARALRTPFVAFRFVQTKVGNLSVQLTYRQKSRNCLYMARDALTPTEQTLFAELVQQVQTAEPAGSVYTRERDGIQYYYAKIPVGVGRIDTFIGKVGDDESEQTVAHLKRGMEQASERRRLVSVLRGTGLAAPPRTIGATLDALSQAGLFKNGAVLVGTSAYMMSEPLVGRKLPAPTLMTGDLDLATANLALKAEPPDRLETIIKRGDPTFEPVLQTRPKEPPSRYRTADGFLLDLITPTRRRTDANPIPMEELDAGAAPLQYMDWLIANPVPTVALWGSGVSINVPQPSRFAVHKLILAQKRDVGSRSKRQKDLAQADALIDAIESHDPFDLYDALAGAVAKGRHGWREPIHRSLTELNRENMLKEHGI